MALKQLSIFVENKQGALVKVTDTLASHNVNIRALSIADTEDFGILRIIVNDTDVAAKMLTEEGFLIKVTDVVGVKIGDAPGKLSKALEVLDENGINIDIEVDGGINENNARLVIEAGANVIVAGSAIFKSKTPSQVIKKMRESAIDTKIR